MQTCEESPVAQVSYKPSGSVACGTSKEKAESDEHGPHAYFATLATPDAEPCLFR
jgi:hypothetical protein